MDEIIKVNDVSMRFNLAQEKTETLKEYTVKLLTHKLFFNEFYALKHVSFSVKRGESLALIGRNCEYLEQHFDRTGADASTRQAVADINTAAMQLDRTLSEAITLLEFLHEEAKPQLYPIDLCELLQQVSAQSDMIRAQLGVDIRLDYGGCTACCVMADRRDAELLCLHLLSNALRASREGGCVCIALRRTESGCSSASYRRPLSSTERQ